MFEFLMIISVIIMLIAFLFAPILLYFRFRKSRNEMGGRIAQLEQDVVELKTMLIQRSTAVPDDIESTVLANSSVQTDIPAIDLSIVEPPVVDPPVVDEPVEERGESSLDEWRPAAHSAPLPDPSLSTPSLSTPSLPTPSLDLQPHLSITESELAESELADPILVEEFAENIVTEDAPIFVEDDAEPEWSLPLIGWFLRSNILVQIGIVILFIGIGFLLKYVADLGLLSMGMRHVAVAAGGVALSGIGWFLRKKARFYGLALQGAGLGILYLTTFFAFRVYDLIPAAIAFPILVTLGILCAGLAVINDARVLAFLAVTGAFLAPILASSDTGSHVMLFSYYMLVNISVLAIAWFKAWRSLNLASFFFTLAAGLLWGVTSYHPGLFSSTEPFVLIFFGFFLLIAILYGLRRATDPTATRIDLIDTTLVFGNPFAIFAVQSVLMQPFENGIGLSTAAMGLIYGALSILFLSRKTLLLGEQSDQSNARHPLTEAFLFLSFFFLALSVPLLFEPRTTTATWAVTGAIWVWMGTQRQRDWTRIFGLLVQLGAGAFFIFDYGINEIMGIFSVPMESMPFVNASYVGTLLLAGAGLFSAYQLWRGKEAVANSGDEEEPLPITNPGTRWPVASALVMTWGLGWWFGGGMAEIVELFMPYEFLESIGRLLSFSLSTETVPANLWTTLLLFIAGSATLFEVSGRMLRWQTLRRPMILLLPVLALFSVIQLAYVPHHFAGLGWLIWPCVLGLYYWILFRQQADFGPAHNEAESVSALSLFGLRHAGSFWLLTFILTWFVGWFAGQQWANDIWAISAVSAMPSLLIFLLSIGIDRLPTPIRTYKNSYLSLGIVPVAFFVLVWSLLRFGGSSGSINPMTYIPIVNPLDLSQIGMFAALFVWLRKHDQPTRAMLGRTWGVLGFVALNLLIARTVHHTLAVPYNWDDLFYFAPLQMIYSVLWGALAMGLMFWSRRNGQRILWGSGAVILALTIAKLFLVDLANSESIARIVSFIGVGLLVMIIAYFAPAPQRQIAEENSVLDDYA